MIVSWEENKIHTCKFLFFSSLSALFGMSDLVCEVYNYSEFFWGGWEGGSHCLRINYYFSLCSSFLIASE